LGTILSLQVSYISICVYQDFELLP